MTILNALIEPGRAVLATNSESFGFADGRVGRCEKLMLFPGVSAAICGRGQLSFLFNVFRSCFMLQGDCDAMVDHIPTVWAYVRERLMSDIAKSAPSVDGLNGDAQLVLAGWSARSQRMIGHCFAQVGDDAEMMSAELGEICIISPFEKVYGLPPELPATTRGMHEFVAKQSAKAIEHLGAGSSMGGESIVCELTRDTIAVTRQGINP
jgi:hypothetical protein